MSIIIDENTRVIVQGITGREGSFHTGQMIDYGTKVVGGVVPGKGGTKSEHGIPVFNTVKQAVAETGANASIIFVPARFAPEAILEANDAGLELIVTITDWIPQGDMIEGMRFVEIGKWRVSGPNCPGLGSG